MKVLFVNPHYSHDPYTLLLHPPLGYGYMATHLKAAGHQVEHADLPFLGNTPNALEAILSSYQPDIVGVTSVAQSYCQALEIAVLVKNLAPTTKVVFGGPHVTFLPTECLNRHSSVDYVLLYDAEYSMVALCDALDANAEAAQLATVPGIAYRDDAGRVLLSQAAAPLMQLDELGQPDRTIFDLDPYLKYDYETVVMTARGCPSHCTFCSTTVIGRKPRWNTPTHVVDEMEHVAELGFSSIFFGDDTFSGDPKRAIAIAEEIQRRRVDIPWTSNMRAQDAKPDVLAAIKNAGAYRVFMGFETIQKNALRLVKKGATPERMVEKARLVMSAGLELHASFIIGAPGDTDESLTATLDYIRYLNPTVATFNVMEPRPGTDVFTNPERYGLEIPDRLWYEKSDWLDSPVSRTRTLDQSEIRAWVDRCYFEFCSADFRETERMDTIEEVVDAWSGQQVG